MEGIKILIIIFGLLFLFENKPTNILFNFIGLILTVSVLLGIYKTDYFSYLLIIIYCSALTIIFGFVIMLQPTSSFKTIDSSNVAGFKWKNYLIIIPFILFLINESASKGLNENINNFSGYIKIYNDKIINNIGELLYTNNEDILKFIICTMILLLALIALFYIHNPYIMKEKKEREKENNV